MEAVHHEISRLAPCANLCIFELHRDDIGVHWKICAVVQDRRGADEERPGASHGAVLEVLRHPRSGNRHLKPVSRMGHPRCRRGMRRGDARLGRLCGKQDAQGNNHDGEGEQCGQRRRGRHDARQTGDALGDTPAQATPDAFHDDPSVPLRYPLTSDLPASPLMDAREVRTVRATFGRNFAQPSGARLSGAMTRDHRTSQS